MQITNQVREKKQQHDTALMILARRFEGIVSNDGTSSYDINNINGNFCILMRVIADTILPFS